MPIRQIRDIRKIPVPVNYDRRIEDVRSEGAYDWESGLITSEFFPTGRSGSANIVLHLINFEENISSDDVLAELDFMGLRPAVAHELLTLGIVEPELQLEISIIALGSVWIKRDVHRVVILWRNACHRKASVIWFNTDWRANCHPAYFAAVPK